MFERWRQENFFKYLREEYLIDSLVDYQVEPDDPQRSVPNPTRQAVDKELSKTRADIKKIRQTYGAMALKHFQGGTATLRALTAEQKKIHQELKEANDRIHKLRAQQKSLPKRVHLSQVRPDEEPVKLSTERKHLTNVLKLIAYQIESDLVKLIRPHYARTDDEGRTLIQTALRCAATLEPCATELRVTLCPLSSAHRSQAVAALCEALTGPERAFPALGFACTSPSPGAQNDAKADRLSRGYVRSSEVTDFAGKYGGFDPAIRRFESVHPSQLPFVRRSCCFSFTEQSVGAGPGSARETGDERAFCLKRFGY
jgi:hypothetical protein